MFMAVLRSILGIQDVNWVKIFLGNTPWMTFFLIFLCGQRVIVCFRRGYKTG